jgi:hypothetical protein
VNSGAKRADTPKVRQPTESYRVRLSLDTPPPNATDGRASGRAGLGQPGNPQRRRPRRRISGKTVFVSLLIIALGTWFAWAAQRPGGVSGTVNGWVEHVRGEVSRVSADPDVAKAQRYYNAQYKTTSSYPQLNESDLAAVGVGVGVSVYWCSAQAVVIQGASGGGTASRLLLAGKDLGEVTGKYGCPSDLGRPAPWK